MKSYLQDEAFKDKLVRIRNDFHANPELSHEEFETTEKIRRYVTDLGYEVLDIGLKTGLVARLRTKEEAPSVYCVPILTLCRFMKQATNPMRPK